MSTLNWLWPAEWQYGGKSPSASSSVLRGKSQDLGGSGGGGGGVRRHEEAVLYRDYFTSSELRALCRYKNRGCDKSITYQYIMSPLYDRLVELLPRWMAPNCVTLLGFLALLLSHVMFMYYAPTLSEDVPRWVYSLNFVGLATYMVMDNLDGRQARRTGSSSPLGHLFDHLCDALSVLITGLGVATTLRLGNNISTLLLIWSFGMAVFVTATIEEFHTGSLVLREINGANEGLLCMQGFYLCAAMFGTDFWVRQVSITSWLSLPLGKCILFLVVPVSLPTIFCNYLAVYRKRTNLLREAFHDTIPFLVMSMLMFTWAMTSDVMENYPLLFSWTCELTFTHLVSSMIVAHLCARPTLPSFSYLLIPLAVGTANALVTKFFGDGLLELPLLFGAMVVNLVVSMTTVYRISRQICDHLHIYVFSLGIKKD